MQIENTGVQSIEWTFDSAKNALTNPPFKLLKFALKTITYSGAVIAATLTLTAIVEFAAVLLIPAAAFAVTSVAFAILLRLTGEEEQKVFDDEGLTKAKQSEILSTHFKETITTKSMSVETAASIDEDFSVFGHYLERRYNPYLEEEPEFAIDDRELANENVDDLLFTAYTKDIVLHLKSLEILTVDISDEISENWKKETNNDTVVPEAVKSALIAARFVANCFKKNDVQIDAMNRQLFALGVKYVTYDGNQAEAVAPSIMMEAENTAIVRSMWGENGDLKDILDTLIESGKNVTTIKIFSEAFYWKRNEPDHDLTLEEAEEEIIKHYPGIEIIFEPLDDIEENFWQEESPRFHKIIPGEKEKSEYAKKITELSVEKD